MREKGGLGYKRLPRMIDHVPFWYRKRCSNGFYRRKNSIRMTNLVRFCYRPKTDNLKVSVNFSTESRNIFSAAPVAFAFRFFNKLVASVVVLLAFALGNGCGGGSGAEYEIFDYQRYLDWFKAEAKEEEEEIHRRNEEICKKLSPGSETAFHKNPAKSIGNGKIRIGDGCNGIPLPHENVTLENIIPEILAKAGLDWKEHPYKVHSIFREIDKEKNKDTIFTFAIKYLGISISTFTKSCMESYPEYSQVIFQNGECNGQNPTRNYVPKNDKNIISKTDIDDVHKKNKDICNKISGHNYTRGETEIIDNDNVTFTDECKVDIYKEMWTENIIAELFYRKGLTEIPYKINFIWADKPSPSYKSTVCGIKIPNMDIFVTLHKTKSCLLSCPGCNQFFIEPNPQVQGYGECIQEIVKENTSAYFKKDKQR